MELNDKQVLLTEGDKDQETKRKDGDPSKDENDESAEEEGEEDDGEEYNMFFEKDEIESTKLNQDLDLFDDIH
jgi:hypothetical protein